MSRRAKYRPTWDLSTIPEPELRSEWARRNGLRGVEARRASGFKRASTCDCGECPKCLKREAMRVYRAKARAT